jgi:polyhydroxyalkanoate synthase subunit PhaC
MSISSETNPINERMIPKNEKIDMQLKADVAYDYDKFAKLYHNLSLQINVGSTQHEVSLENRLYRLLHYRPIFNRPIKTPILIVYALINRSYILDLQPDKSWIRNLLYQGFDIYLIDWKPPSQNDKYVTFDDYVNYFIDDCVDHIRDESSIDKITLHGYCMGATMSTMYCSLHQHKLRNLVTIAPVIDTSKDYTVIGNFAKHLDIDKIINSSGNLPPELLRSCFAALKPYKQGINKYFALMEHIDNKNFVENFLRIEKWLDDIPAITGETSRQWIKDIYQNNLLAKNEMRLGNKLVDLSKINIPLLNLVADQDHLVTPTCSIPLNDLVSSTDNRLMKFPTGHVGMIASSYSQNYVLPKVGRWFFMRS